MIDERDRYGQSKNLAVRNGQEKRMGVSLLLTPGQLSTENRLIRKRNRRPVSLQDDRRMDQKRCVKLLRQWQNLTKT